MSTAKALSNSLLKGILTDAVVGRGQVADLDTCKTAGTYYVGNPQNLPEGAYNYGVLIVYQNERLCLQMYLPRFNTKMYIRIYYERWMGWNVFTPS